MELDYKTYAKDLYNIKLATLGHKPTDKNLGALMGFFNKINNLRPRLREELTQLEKEFISTVPNPPKDFVEHIHEVNHRYIKKLQAFANRVKREIRSYKA